MLLGSFVCQIIGIYLGIDEVPGVLTWIAMVVIIIALNTLEKGSSEKNAEIKVEDTKANMISKFGVYFGMKSINISHQESKATINQCELLAIKYTLNAL